MPKPKIFLECVNCGTVLERHSILPGTVSCPGCRRKMRQLFSPEGEAMIVGEMEAKRKGIDVCNGVVIRGSRGTLLFDVDKSGVIAEHPTVVSVGGWPDDIMADGTIRPSVIVLVHSVKGDNEILLRRLEVRGCKRSGATITVDEVIDMGMFPDMVLGIWKDYMSGNKERIVFGDGQ